MNVATQARCQHVYLHVDRKSLAGGHAFGVMPFWKCALKKKDLEGVCMKLSELGIESACHPEECSLASRHMPWDHCPLYSPTR